MSITTNGRSLLRATKPFNYWSYYSDAIINHFHLFIRTPRNGPRWWSRTLPDVANSPVIAPLPSMLVRFGAWSPRWNHSPPLTTSNKLSTWRHNGPTFPACITTRRIKSQFVRYWASGKSHHKPASKRERHQMLPALLQCVSHDSLTKFTFFMHADLQYG